MEAFNPQHFSADTDRTFAVVTMENGASNVSVPPENSVAQGLQNDLHKGREETKLVKGSSTIEEGELTAEFLENQIPRKKKAMQTKIRQLLIEVQGKNEIITTGKKILDRLTSERERQLERIEEKERVIEGKELIIQSFQEKIQNFQLEIGGKDAELRESKRLLTEANQQVELLRKQLVGQEEIVKEMQATIDDLVSKKGNASSALRRTVSSEIDARVEIESIKRDNDRLKLEIREHASTVKERDSLIISLNSDKETLIQEKRESDNTSLERKFTIDRLSSERERGLAYLNQLEIRITEKQQTLNEAQDDLYKLRNQLRQNERMLSEKDMTIETLEKSQKITSDRLDRLEKQLREERQTQRAVNDTLREEKRSCEDRLRRAEVDLEAQQRRVRVLEHEMDRARQSVGMFRKDQPWMIQKDEITLTDKILGTGAWGTVVEGSFRGTKVAVKQLHEIIQSAHNRLLFDREITFATLVRHPCILQFLAVADYRTSNPLLVAELMDMSLSQLVRNGKILGNRIIRILALDVAYGINYLHCFQPDPILHRDVNSGNVMVWRQGDKWRGKICDFGSAEFWGSKMSENPGNPFYSAPETNTCNQSSKVRRVLHSRILVTNT